MLHHHCKAKLSVLGSRHEKYFRVQVVGFVVILSGSSLYNELIRICLPDTAVADETDIEVSLLAGSSAFQSFHWLSKMGYFVVSGPQLVPQCQNLETGQSTKI